MALDFPNPSQVGQTYTDPTTGKTYRCVSLGPPAVWGNADGTPEPGTDFVTINTQQTITGAKTFTQNTYVGDSNQISLNAAGNATFAGGITSADNITAQTITAGLNPNGGGNIGIRMRPQGALQVCNTGANATFQSIEQGGSTTCEITAAGNATFTGSVTTGDLVMNNTRHENGNEVDGTHGHWCFQEGKTSVYVINRLTGQRYSINLTPVD